MKKERILYLMMGAPGSGKSTWVKEQIVEKGGIHISRDAIRFSLVKENEEYFSKENLVIETFLNDIQRAIDTTNEDVYVDATHISTKSRNAILKNLWLRKIDIVEAVLIDPGLEIALERNNLRSSREKVPEQVIKSMYKNLTYPTEGEKLINKFTIIN